ncbi:unnamed protein product [Clavelina lepadiformis]|uniref:Alpha-carbonic anhydrase domain-containing protein n=1 Tax=Clavelina lepadiformis TaxID=159417 RepID=A0ABP0GGF0_CLALP
MYFIGCGLCVVFYFLHILELQRSPLAAAEWGYGVDNGPESWKNTYWLCGHSSYQSPIDIDASKGNVVRKLRLLDDPSIFEQWPSSMIVINNGHTR